MMMHTAGNIHSLNLAHLAPFNDLPNLNRIHADDSMNELSMDESIMEV